MNKDSSKELLERQPEKLPFLIKNHQGSWGLSKLKAKVGYLLIKLLTRQLKTCGIEALTREKELIQLPVEDTLPWLGKPTSMDQP